VKISIRSSINIIFFMTMFVLSAHIPTNACETAHPKEFPSLKNLARLSVLKYASYDEIKSLLPGIKDILFQVSDVSKEVAACLKDSKRLNHILDSGMIPDIECSYKCALHSCPAIIGQTLASLVYFLLPRNGNWEAACIDSYFCQCYDCAINNDHHCWRNIIQSIGETELVKSLPACLGSNNQEKTLGSLLNQQDDSYDEMIVCRHITNPELLSEKKLITLKKLYEEKLLNIAEEKTGTLEECQQVGKAIQHTKDRGKSISEKIKYHSSKNPLAQRSLSEEFEKALKRGNIHRFYAFVQMRGVTEDNYIDLYDQFFKEVNPNIFTTFPSLDAFMAAAASVPCSLSSRSHHLAGLLMKIENKKVATIVAKNIIINMLNVLENPTNSKEYLFISILEGLHNGIKAKNLLDNDDWSNFINGMEEYLNFIMSENDTAALDADDIKYSVWVLLLHPNIPDPTINTILAKYGKNPHLIGAVSLLINGYFFNFSHKRFFSTATEGQIKLFADFFDTLDTSALFYKEFIELQKRQIYTHDIEFSAIPNESRYRSPLFFKSMISGLRLRELCFLLCPDYSLSPQSQAIQLGKLMLEQTSLEDLNKAWRHLSNISIDSKRKETMKQMVCNALEKEIKRRKLINVKSITIKSIKTTISSPWLSLVKGFYYAYKSVRDRSIHYWLGSLFS
jgi:hypothetical protein